MRYGWGLYRLDDPQDVAAGGEILTGSPCRYESAHNALQAGMAEMDERILATTVQGEAERLMVVVFDQNGDAHAEARARRLTGWN
jgi:hypothetical protein